MNPLRCFFGSAGAAALLAALLLQVPEARAAPPADAPVPRTAPAKAPVHTIPKIFMFGFDMQLVREGSGMALHLGVEGYRAGFNLRVERLGLRADENNGGRDSLGVLSSHLSYALLMGDRGRVRAEAGLSGLRVREATFVGPGLGVSAEYYLLDVLAVEGRVYVTPMPYRQLDAVGGLVFYFFDDLFGVRGGWRLLGLDDAGLVDGLVHRDLFMGPTLSLSLVF